MARDKKGLKARQELLRAVIRYCGGVTRVSKMLGNSNKQFAENWIQRGAVPFVLTKRLERRTGIHPAVFNYEDHCIYNGTQLRWKDVVKVAPIPEEVKATVLSFAGPEIPADAGWEVV